MRGKFGGLYNTVESLGRFASPVGFATTFAWSISPSAYEWVNYRFVFYVFAFVMFAVAVLGWRGLTLETFMQPSESEHTESVPPGRIAGRSAESAASFVSTPHRDANLV